MDINYFLKKRTTFIREFYSTGARPFEEIREQIEGRLPPFDDPPYSEDGEPAFLEEWQQVVSGREILCLACVSLLSDSLKLYFEALRSRIIGFTVPKKHFKDRGFVAVYREVLGHILETDWLDCSADFGIIEQIVLARNRGQHGVDFHSFDITHDQTMLKKYPNPHFASNQEHEIWIESGGTPDSFLAPRISVTCDSLFAATDHVEKLADYIESRLHKVTAWRMQGKSP